MDAIRSLMKSVTGFWDEAWRADVLERALGSAGTIAIVYVAPERVDGFARAHDVGFRAYLSELVVAPTSRHGGVGGQLLSEIERRLAERGWSVVIADVWADAEAFYRSHGWAPPPVVSMRRRLTKAAAPPVTG